MNLPDKLLFTRTAYFFSVLLYLLLLTPTYTNAFNYGRGVRGKTTGLRQEDPDTRVFYIAAADTRDDSIGDRCKADVKQMTKAYNDIANWLYAEDQSQAKIISGNKYSKAAVIDAIDNWLPGKHLTQSDIVIFYYSGHGFRLQSDTSKYPRMWLKTATDKDVDNNNLRIEEDIYNRLIKLGAGMTIVLSDCCNNTFGTNNANYDNVQVSTSSREVHKRAHPRVEDGDEDDDEDYGDRLFITEHPVSILATAAGKGELAGGKPYEGGFFTTYLLDALYSCIYHNDIQPSWQILFDFADDKAGYLARSAACPLAKHNAQGRCMQTAVVKIMDADK